jgi:hypothetical protein
MWTYSGPSCLDHPSSEELSVAEMEARIRKVLDLRVNMNPGSGPVPLWRGIASVRVGTLGPVSTTFMSIFFHYAHDLAQGLGGGRDKPRDVDSPSDATRWEARHASSEETWVHEEREIGVPPNGWQKGGGRRPPLDLRPLVRGKWKEAQLYLPCLPPV